MHAMLPFSEQKIYPSEFPSWGRERFQYCQLGRETHCAVACVKQMFWLICVFFFRRRSLCRVCKPPTYQYCRYCFHYSCLLTCNSSGEKRVHLWQPHIIGKTQPADRVHSSNWPRRGAPMTRVSPGAYEASPPHSLAYSPKQSSKLKKLSCLSQADETCGQQAQLSKYRAIIRITTTTTVRFRRRTPLPSHLLRPKHGDDDDDDMNV